MLFKHTPPPQLRSFQCAIKENLWQRETKLHPLLGHTQNNGVGCYAELFPWLIGFNPSKPTCKINTYYLHFRDYKAEAEKGYRTVSVTEWTGQELGVPNTPCPLFHSPQGPLTSNDNVQAAVGQCLDCPGCFSQSSVSVFTFQFLKLRIYMVIPSKISICPETQCILWSLQIPLQNGSRARDARWNIKSARALFHTLMYHHFVWSFS